MLQRYTLTGLDNKTDLSAAADLSDMSQGQLEWGILYSVTRPGEDPRYPHIDEIVEMSERLRDLGSMALHYCGRTVRNLVEGERQAWEISKLFDRLQLNFNASGVDFTPAEIQRVANSFPGRIIIQHKPDNAAFISELTPGSVDILFDTSGGNGIRGEWQEPLDGFHCGYAGGIGPATIAGDIERAEKASQGKNHWIDMENALRDDNLLNLDKCRVIVKAVLEAQTTTPEPSL